MPSSPPTDLREVLLETYAINDAMNQLLLAHLDPHAWRAEPKREWPHHRHHLRAPA